MTRRHLAVAALTILLGVVLAAHRQTGNGGEEGVEPRILQFGIKYDF